MMINRLVGEDAVVGHGRGGIVRRSRIVKLMSVIVYRRPVHRVFEIELGIILEAFQQQVVLIGIHIQSLIP